MNVLSAERKCTPLMIASEFKDLTGAKFLLEHGANVDLQDEYGCISLPYALKGISSDTSYDAMKCLLENGADVNAPTNDNCAPLMMASRSDNVRIINFLLKHGANVLKDRNGKTALHHACRKDTCRSRKVLSRLIKNGADINACGINNCTPLIESTRHCYVNKARFLIKHGANVHLRHNIDGDTALHYAIGQSLPEIVSAL